MSLTKQQLKKHLDVAGAGGASESYSNEQFESFAESRTLGASSNDEKISCFMCKQQIPKS
jgi:hypothetical protein